jgi:hypothetical protein
MKTWIAFALCLLASFSARAVTEANKTILSMGVQDTSSASTAPVVPQAYVILSPPPTTNCVYGIAYIKDLSTAGGTALLSMLQKAYSLSKPLSRIDYSQDSASGQCFITLIEVGK